MVQPRFTVAADATIRIDAGAGKAVRVSVPDSAAEPTLVSLNAFWNDGLVGFSAVEWDTTGLFVGQIEPDKPAAHFVGSTALSFAAPGPAGSFDNNPRTYDLLYTYPGKMPTGLHKSPAMRDLATIKTRYSAEAVGATGGKTTAPEYPGIGYTWSIHLRLDLPFQATEYVNDDGVVKWSSLFEQDLPATGDGSQPTPLTYATSRTSTFRTGQVYHRDWNKAVFAPSVGPPQAAGDYVTRTGNVIKAAIPAFSEGPGHIGYSNVESATLSLYRNGTLVATKNQQSGQFEVPVGTADYRLELSATRGAPHRLSTRVRGSWTFRSGQVPGTTPKRLALSTVRFDPKLDSTNTAPAGRMLAVPIHVDHQLGTTTSQLSAEVSFDEGTTWKSVRVTGSGDHRVAMVRHPAGAGFVSLRAHATDQAGNKVDQTVIKAYAIS